MGRRDAALLGLLALLAAALPASGCSSRAGRVVVREENDVFNIGRGFDTDQDYTQGGVAALTLPEDGTPEWARAAARALPLFAEGSRVNLGLLLGQEIYTPVDISREVPDPEDRPYAGWLYVGLALQGRVLDEDPLARRDRMDSLELDVGVVGPASLAEPSQNIVHGLLDIPDAEGWDHQLGNEPGLQAAWERRYRVLAPDLGEGFGADLLPGFRARLGTVRVDASVGALGRIGWRLPRDFGPRTVDGTGLEVGAAAPPPWIALVGSLDARGVLHDLFLEGGTFRDGPSVTPANLVYESSAGIAAGWGPLQISFVQNFVSPQFREDRRYHSYTSLTASFAWGF